LVEKSAADCQSLKSADEPVELHSGTDRGSLRSLRRLTVAFAASLADGLGVESALLEEPDGT